MAQWSWMSAAGNSAVFTVWSGWWWLNTTSVTSPGSGPAAASAASSAARSATIPGSTMITRSPSMMSTTVLATRLPSRTSRT